MVFFMFFMYFAKVIRSLSALEALINHGFKVKILPKMRIIRFLATLMKSPNHKFPHLIPIFRRMSGRNANDSIRRQIPKKVTGYLR